MAQLGPVSMLARGARTAGSSAILAATILLAAGTAGFVLNWTMLLAVLPPDEFFSAGARYLVFGLLFPISWMAAAQPLAVAQSLRRVYRSHRNEVLTLISGALQSELPEGSSEDPGRWMRAFEEFRAHIDRYPRLIRALLRLGLRRLPMAEIETALRGGSGPAPVRIAGAIADHIEAELGGLSSALWLVGVVGANLIAFALVFHFA